MRRIQSAVANMLEMPFKALWGVCENSNIKLIFSLDGVMSQFESSSACLLDWWILVWLVQGAGGRGLGTECC